MWERSDKPACPECGAEAVAEILYGLVNTDDEELRKDLDAGDVLLGGCVRVGPRWVCRKCGGIWEQVAS